MAEVRPWHRGRDNSVSPFKQSFAKLIENGYSPLPIKAGTKRPAIKEWSDFCGVQPDSETLEQWVRSFPVAGLGVACGYGGLASGDIDTTNPDIVAAIEGALLLHGPLSPFGKVGKKGKTLFYNAGAGIHSRKFLDKDKKVIFEILADGCQTIIPPTIHPDTGQPYQWLDARFTLFDTPISELPTIGEGLANELEMALKPWLAVEKDFPELKARDPTKAVGDIERKRLIGFSEVKLRERCKDLSSMGANSGRNWEAYLIACAMGRFGHHGILPLPQIEAAILDACATNGLIGEDGRRAVMATIRSGFNRARNDALPELAEREREGKATKEAEQPSAPFLVYEASALISTKAPAREWLIDGWMPANDVTLLGADGGTGKTQLALQLGYAGVTGWDWLGLAVMQCPVIYYSAEEPRDELHFRLHQIAAQMPPGKMAAEAFGLISVADDDAELAVFDKDGKISPTKRFRELEDLIARRGARLLILDAVADVFGGNEIDRRQVRSFVRMLRGLAIRQRCAIMLLAHPSVDGIKTGRGYSGSTHWNNAVRSRLYFTTPVDENGQELDPDLREITVKKANRARRGAKIFMRWQEGAFMPDSGDSVSDALIHSRARMVFLELLKRFNQQGRYVGPSAGVNFAPSVFSKESDASGILVSSFRKAMSELLNEGLIVIEAHGPPSTRRQHLWAIQ